MNGHQQDNGVRTAFERWRSGDDGALDAVLEQLLPRLTTHARRRMGPGLRGLIETHDAVQDTVAEFLKSIDRQALAGIADLERVLRAMIENTLRGKHRYHHRGKRDVDRQQRVATEVGDDLGATSTTPSRVAARKEEAGDLGAAIASLDDVDRRIVRARSEGRGFEDIGRDVGLTADAARKRYTRAFDRLRKRLRGDG